MHHEMSGNQEDHKGYLFIVPNCELVSIAGGDLQGVEALYSHMQSAGILHAGSASDAWLWRRIVATCSSRPHWCPDFSHACRESMAIRKGVRSSASGNIGCSGQSIVPSAVQCVSLVHNRDQATEDFTSSPPANCKAKPVLTHTFLNLFGVPHSLEIKTLCLGWYLHRAEMTHCLTPSHDRQTIGGDMTPCSSRKQ